MTIQELYDYLKKFINEHPKCKDQEVMVANPNEKGRWEEITKVSDTVVESCPEYGSPLYFHSKTQQKRDEEYYKELEAKETDDYINM